MKKTLIAAIIAASIVPAYASGWTNTDTKREIAFDVLSVMDSRQTHYIIEHGNRYEETNPILGDHPSSKAVDTYFISEMIGHYAVSYLLPEKYREYWQYGTIAVELGYVAHNYDIGIRMDF